MIPRNPFDGLSAANTAAQLHAMTRNARLQEAIQIREAARVLGVPPAAITPEADEMLAGGDIKYEIHNHAPDHSVVAPRRPMGGSWIIPSAILGAAILVAAWLISGQQAPVVIKPPGPPPAANAGGYIEFYRPRP